MSVCPALRGHLLPARGGLAREQRVKGLSTITTNFVCAWLCTVVCLLLSSFSPPPSDLQSGTTAQNLPHKGLR